MPLERQIAVDALPAAICTVPNESAITARPVAPLTSRAAKAPTTPAAESAAASPTKSSSATAARPPAPRTSWSAWSAWNAGGLAFDTRSEQSTGRLHTQDRSAQPEIILAGLQSVAQRSVDQERLVGIPWRLGTSVLRRRRGNLVQFVFCRSRRGAEAALLLRTLLCEFSRLSLPLRLQLERPFSRRLAL